MQLDSKFKRLDVSPYHEPSALMLSNIAANPSKGPAPKRMAKNNSFNEKSNSDVKTAIQASLGATDDGDECASPMLRRGRGMTEGVDEHQINLLNANTQGMIRQRVGQLQRQTSLKRSQLGSTETPTLNFLAKSSRQISTDSYGAAADLTPNRK